MVAEHGGRPIHFPTIAIGPAADQASARVLLQGIADYHMAIFISPNAVRYGLELLGADGLPAGIEICAVGKGTARVLSEMGIAVDVLPPGRSDSEALLILPELAKVAGKRILILRGNGGRELLTETLRQRGAKVDHAEVYARTTVSADAGPLVAVWEKEIDIVTATSGEILENLFSLLGEEGGTLLRKTPLLVVSARIRDRARELGCGRIIMADDASDLGLFTAICEWSDGIKSGSSDT